MFSLVIVAYNSAQVLPLSLASIAKGNEVIVVDNASSDQSVAVARSLGARVIELPDNLGFGTACNRGAEIATADMLLFLNPDAILQADTLARLAEALEAHPDTDVFSPRIVDSAGHEYYRHRTILLPRPYLLKPPVPRADAPIRMFSGAAVCIRTAAFRAIGGFDENIFLYYEDDDLAARMTKAGRKMRYVHDAIVLHDPTRSTVDTPEIAMFREFSAMRSRLFTLRKHGRPNLVWVNLPRDIARLAKARIRGNDRDAALIRARISAMLGRKGPPKP